MGLPVEEIMAEVEEELMNMNEEELDHMDGEVHEDLTNNINSRDIKSPIREEYFAKHILW